MINKTFSILLIINILNGEVIRDDENYVVFDTASKLMWQDNNDAIFNKYNWESAISYCEDLNFSGHTDWRLPNINELYTLVDFTKTELVINSKFTNIKNSRYWTSSSAKLNLSNGWYIDFTDGSSAYQVKSSTTTLTRCVRDIN
jgi:hypothetical protein